jgi:hypothetical protein
MLGISHRPERAYYLVSLLMKERSAKSNDDHPTECHEFYVQCGAVFSNSTAEIAGDILIKSAKTKLLRSIFE